MASKPNYIIMKKNVVFCYMARWKKVQPGKLSFARCEASISFFPSTHWSSPIIHCVTLSFLSEEDCGSGSTLPHLGILHGILTEDNPLGSYIATRIVDAVSRETTPTPLVCAFTFCEKCAQTVLADCWGHGCTKTKSCFRSYPSGEVRQKVGRRLTRRYLQLFHTSGSGHGSSLL